GVAGDLVVQAQSGARGGIVRTILGDVDPSALKGITLMHEHLGTGVRPSGGRPVTSPGQDLDWAVEEVKGAQKLGVNCIVAATTAMPGPEVPGYLKEL